MKIFLDCGSNIGQEFERQPFYDMVNQDWIIHCFEPNPLANEIVRQKYGKRFLIHECAVWNEDCTRELNVEFCPHENKNVGGASNVLQETFVKPFWIAPENMVYTVPVQCIDFSKWMTENVDKDDHIIVKMDIEGSEYYVLDKMLKDGTIKLVDLLYVEWHEHMLTARTLDLIYAVKAELVAAGTAVIEWNY